VATTFSSGMDASEQMTSGKILIALQSYEAGGAEQQAVYLATGLKQRGYDVTVLAFGPFKGLALERFKAAGIKTITPGFHQRQLLGPMQNLKARILLLKYSLRLIYQVRQLQVDAVLAFTYPANMIFGRFWKWMKVKAFFWNQRDGGFKFTGSSLEVSVLENCTGIISNSQEGKRFLEKYTRKEIRIIHNGVAISETQVKLRAAENKLRVVMVANLHANKDHITLLNAWGIVKNRTDRKIELLLAGKEGETSEAIRSLISERQLSDSVMCLGQVRDIQGLLSTCDVGVLSSINEGLPNGILECMAAGLPVVATRMLGSLETLGEDYDFLVDRENPMELGEKITRLVEDEKLREVVGNQNRQRVRNEFNMDKMIDSYMRLIH
jgi:glycosyltransferase involved in cell wall biosynthesis